ncbi:MAG TPA: tRNA lysidine(34) synthetase TilS [Ohtaekwangia sp.]|nr:tRNA lysidine(34) synthetase TilS [Ohtaekwangia sp.]
MLQQFLNHIAKQALCTTSDRILLAVSGGVDSMAMLHLFKSAGYEIGVAHCNFQLRGFESDADETLVKETCDALRIPFYSIRFDTTQYAGQHGLSIQVAARELRYNFFKQIQNEQRYNHVATAHHLNDQTETVILNLIRGTGIDGLTGIPSINGQVIRPMLFATREEISGFAKQHNIIWREDLSNESDHYSRNLIRNQLIPLIKKINPGFEAGFMDTLSRIQGSKSLAQHTLKQVKVSAVKQQGDSICIEKTIIQDFDFPEVVLWEIIKPYHFHFNHCKQIVLEHQSGKVFISDTHELTVDRDHFIITAKKASVSFSKTILANDTVSVYGGEKLTIQYIPSEHFTLIKKPELAQLDLAKIKFPLTWRTWQPGDSFSPLGMSRQKKLSDFLIDRKVSMPDKQTVSVIESAGEIVWVVGFIISNWAKVTGDTKDVLVITRNNTDGCD